METPTLHVLYLLEYQKCRRHPFCFENVKQTDGENEFYASRTSLWHDLAKHDLGKLNIATSCHACIITNYHISTIFCNLQDKKWRHAVQIKWHRNQFCAKETMRSIGEQTWEALLRCS